MRAAFGYRTYALGRRELIAPFLPAGSDGAAAGGLPKARRKYLWVARDLAGRLVFEDTLRPESAGLLARLHSDHVATVMLTGDRRATAERMARELGIGEVRAELLPDQKLAAIQQLKQNGRRIGSP